MRIAILGIYHESNTFLTKPTTREEFEQGALLYGPDIRRLYADAYHEIGGMLEVLDASEIEAVPVFFAQATPGGTITQQATEWLIAEMLAELKRQGPFDGFLTVLHGAAVSISEPDLDGHLLHLLRQYAGKSLPIIGTLDPHANVSTRMVDNSTALIAYRTNPHLDQRERGMEAARLMVRTLRQEIRPTQAFAQPDMLIGIEYQYSEALPCREVYEQLDGFLSRPFVLSNSLILGFPYADVPEMGSGFLVVTDGKPELSRAYVKELADYLWGKKENFTGGTPDIQEALQLAAEAEGPTLLLDMGDNVGGGSPGDSTFLLEALERWGSFKSFVCLYDPAAVKHAVAVGTGASVELAMGGKMDDLHGPSYRAKVTVKAVADGRFTEEEPRHGGQQQYDMGKTVIVETPKNTTVMLTSRRMPPFSLKQLTTFGIIPQAYDVLVAKGVNAPIAAYMPVCRQFIRVDTPGITRVNLSSLPYKNRRKPLFPLDSV